MNFTDIFIKRPVLAAVISLLILVLGLRSVGSLPINQYPHTENAVVTITTAYYGADSATVAGFITQPLLTVQVGQTIDAMYMGFYSDTIPSNNVTDYLLRVVKPKLDSVEGVQTAEILGARQFALRAWLDASKLAAHNVTAQDVFTALGNNNYLAAV